MSFEKWFNTLLKEENINDYKEIEIEDDGDFHYINVKTLKDFCLKLPDSSQEEVRRKYNWLEAKSLDTSDFLIHLANGLV